MSAPTTSPSNDAQDDDPQAAPADRIRVGVSSCLLGQKVRYDGQHKLDRFVASDLGAWFDFVPICPEMGIGLGTPRPPIRLVHIGEDVRARGVDDSTLDVTDRLAAYFDDVADQVAGVSAYILKRASPSCGMERVKVYSEKGHPGRAGTGIFAGAMMARFPNLPVEEEGRLNDPVLRENFIERVFVYRRWQAFRSAPTPKGLIDFHARHKLQIMAHNQAAYRRLGQRVATAGTEARAGRMEALLDEYEGGLMATLKRRATRRTHTNVLMHLMGYLKKQLDTADKQELLEVFGRYRHGTLPLIVPMTLLKHHFRRHPDPYVQGQHYLDPHPAELMLRNHV